MKIRFAFRIEFVGVPERNTKRGLMFSEMSVQIIILSSTESCDDNIKIDLRVADLEDEVA